MVLLIDIGNTVAAIGGCDGAKMLFTGHCGSDLKKTEDEYALTIKGILELNGYSAGDIEGGIISSVVPALRPVMYQAMKRLTGHRFLMVGSGIKTGLNIRMDNPAALGSDLVVNAVAACDKYQERPLLIFYLGTATTVSVIDRNSNYLGGMIVPGLRISADALSERAAQLPMVPLSRPQRIIGRNTVECMQSGILIGCAAMLDGIVERIEEELGESVTAIATGCYMEAVLPLCKRSIRSEPDLRLEGLRLLYWKNQRGLRH